MNRVLFVAALGVFGLGMMGCATAVEDPVQQVPAPADQLDPPAQTLSGNLKNPPPARGLKEDDGVNVSALVDVQHQPPKPTPEHNYK